MVLTFAGAEHQPGSRYADRREAAIGISFTATLSEGMPVNMYGQRSP